MRSRLIDALYLLALAVCVFALPPTFHGDEAMQIYMSSDYATAFIDHNPVALVTVPPYPIDSDQHLRLINGSINRYAIGLSWHLAGFTVNDLPPRPGWDWGLDYDTNAATGHMPAPALMLAARFSSTLFLALSVVVMFALGWRFGLRFGWQFGGRALAYIVSGLYAVNPIVLLNGRRAMQEGSMLFFGLLVILVAALISERRSEGDKPAPLYLWLALVVAGGLALASKHSSIVFVAGALGWIFAAELIRLRWRDLLLTTVRLAVAGALMVVLFVALSPALWNAPLTRIGDLFAARTELLDIQVTSDSLAPTTLTQRIEGIVAQPFMMPPQHFEVAFWGEFPTVTADIDRYMASPLSGVQFGSIVGGVLTLLAGVGIIMALLRLRSRDGNCAGLLVWLLVTAASLLANPLPWQRYSLPLLPTATLLAGIGLVGIVRRFVVKSEQRAA